jgi:glycerol-3-phosphate dehydrogenase (NAD(P)+)
MQKYVIAVIGGGNLGTAMASILSAGSNDVRVWDKDPSRSSAPGLGIEASLEGASHAFVCVPSWVLREVLRDLATRLGRGTVIVGMSKGIEAAGKRTVDELLAELLPVGQPWAIISGPMLAAELSAGKAGAAAAASRDAAVRSSLSALFAGTRILVEETPDTHGVALCGVLKNVYAVGLGIGAALGWADNLRGWYASVALRECIDVLAALGGDSATVLGPAGAGDLIATGFSPGSKNRQYGEEIVRRGSCPFVSEGCASLPHLLDRIGVLRGRLAALDAVARVILEGEKAADAFGGLRPRS